MIYLDNAATSYPKPRVVKRELLRALKKYPGNPGRGGHRLSLAAAETVFRARTAVKTLLHAENEEQIIWTQNATFAINTVLRARVEAGMHILLSDLEHNAVFRPIHRLMLDGTVTYTIFPHTGNVIETLETLVRENTRMLFCTHISNVNGHVMPVEEIAAFCKSHGIYFVLDASQSLGHREVTVDRIPCDALCAPGHKGLLGIQGSGFLYVRSKEGLRDVFQGGSGSHSLSPKMPQDLPDLLEPGTLSTPAIGCLGASVRYLLSHGVAEAEAKELAFSRRIHLLLSEMPDVELFSRPNTGIAAFRVPGVSSDTIATELNRRGVCVRGGYHCSPLAHRALGTLDTGLVRLSAGIYSTEKQAEKTARYLREFLADLPIKNR
ncbi:MAG: aminotransferase class V-fold PLP-dependent enzyme [Eubacteriales bacterium]